MDRLVLIGILIILFIVGVTTGALLLMPWMPPQTNAAVSIATSPTYNDTVTHHPAGGGYGHPESRV